MTSLSLYQNKKRRTNSPSFLPHINETILLMGPHLGRISVHRMWFRTAFCFSSRVKSTGVSHSTCRSSFLWHAITIPRTAESLQSLSLSLSLIYIYMYIYSQVLSKPSFQTDQSRVRWAEFSGQEGRQHDALSFHLGVEKVLILFQHFMPTC